MRSMAEYFHGLAGVTIPDGGQRGAEVTPVTPADIQGVTDGSATKVNPEAGLQKELHRLHQLHHKTEPQNKQNLQRFIELAMTAQTIGDLRSILIAFGAERWELTERAAMSDSYTAHAQRFIEREGAEKRMVLEDLAVLCWSPNAEPVK